MELGKCKRCHKQIFDNSDYNNNDYRKITIEGKNSEKQTFYLCCYCQRDLYKWLLT